MATAEQFHAILSAASVVKSRNNNAFDKLILVNVYATFSLVIYKKIVTTTCYHILADQ